MPLRWREGTPDPADSWSLRDRIDQRRLTSRITASGAVRLAQVEQAVLAADAPEREAL